MAISDEPSLREKVREVIQARKLPNRRPDRTWGGPGAGVDCSICSVPVTHDEVEFEIEFAHNGNNPGVDTHHVHVRCFASWECERQAMSSGEQT